MSTGGRALLRARDVHVSRARREVIHGLDLELREGQVTALLGPNGAGKSTLLDALAGLIPLSGGSVERGGRVALGLQAPDLARRSVAANVALALSWWGVPRAERRGRAHQALAAMHADHLADRPSTSLSGGERRRVHLARTVAVRPDVLLLDEPFAGLDAATRASLLEDTGAALRAWASAALVVVHERAEAWALADRLLILLDGRIVADGTPRRLLEHPPSVDVARFLGFDGTLQEPNGSTLLTRAHHVQLDPVGPLRARVGRVIPLEDGVRLELLLDEGRLFAVEPLPGPEPGSTVNVKVEGGIRFEGAETPPPHQDAGDVPADPAQSARP